MFGIGILVPRGSAASSGIGRGAAGLERTTGLLASVAFAAGLGFVPSAQGAASIGSLEVRPAYFTPNADGVTDTTEVAFVPGGAAESVLVRVDVFRDADDALLETLVPPSGRPSGVEVRAQWDPGPLADGVYRFDVLVVDGADSAFASAEVVADTTAPVVTLGALAPNPFDPAATPPANRLRVPVTVASDSTVATVVRVVTASGAFVDSLGTALGPGTTDFEWDGLEADSGSAPTGLYRVSAASRDLAGNADSTSQSFTLDREPPVLGGVADTVQTIALPVRIEGTATDFDRVVAVEVSTDGGASYAPVDSVSGTDPAVTWSTTLSFADGTPGFHPFRLRARDAVGRTSESLHVVAYDDSLPVLVRSSVLGDGAVRDGGVLRIRTEWSLPDLDLSANLAFVDFDWSPGDEDVTEAPPGTYLIEYRVSPANIRTPGEKSVVIRASTGIVAAQDTVTVTLVEGGPTGDALVSIDRNRLDPDAREIVTISADRPTAPVIVHVYNLAGHLVRELQGDGWVEWDGKGPGGLPCGSGVYVLHVDVEGDTEVRNVAILRGGGP